MAPVLPVSGPGRSPPRTTSWSVHNGLLDVEAQSVAGSSDTSMKLNNDDQVSLPRTFVCSQISNPGCFTSVQPTQRCFAVGCLINIWLLLSTDRSEYVA